MQIWAESGKSALPICNYSQILYQFLTFTQNLKRSLIALRTYGITKSKASNTQADDGYKKIRRKHAQALHSQDFCKQISM